MVVQRRQFQPRPTVGTYLCPNCGHFAVTDVKDSRPTPQGYVRRRRYCNECKSSFSTVEVPVELFQAINLNKPTAIATEALNEAVAKFNELRKAIKRASKI